MNFPENKSFAIQILKFPIKIQGFLTLVKVFSRQ